MKRCKPGDTAIIVADHDFPQNIGVVVQVLGPATEFEYGELWDEDWTCRPSAEVWGWDDDDHTQASAGCAEVAFSDRQLQPIRPAVTEDIDVASCRVA